MTRHQQSTYIAVLLLTNSASIHAFSTRLQPRSSHIQTQYRTASLAAALEDDRREGMADAFAALDSLTLDDFDGVIPSPSVEASFDGDSHFESIDDDGVIGEVYSDMLSDSKEDDTGNHSKITTDGNAQLHRDFYTVKNYNSPILHDVDGIGTDAKATSHLTTADLTEEILAQEIPTLSMQDFVSLAIHEAMDDVTSSNLVPPSSAVAEEWLHDESLRRELDEIFDRAGDKMRLEIEAMKREQVAVTEQARKQGLDYLAAEERRLAEAEESVKRLIQKVARETEEVREAMEELERVREGGGVGVEERALELKKGGIVKQSALVGGILFGSRAIAEMVGFVADSEGGDYSLSALFIQGSIALFCAAYFFLGK